MHSNVRKAMIKYIYLYPEDPLMKYFVEQFFEQIGT